MNIGNIAINVILGVNKMELLQSQAPAKREFFGSSVVRTLKFGNWTFDLRMWTLVVRVWTWKPLKAFIRSL